MAEKIDVFIIDDDESTLQYYQSIINKGDDMRCIGRTTSAETAIDIVAITHPDIVLVDYALYPISGFAIASKLTQEIPDLPIIMLGGRAHLHEKAKEKGASVYLAMPITPRALLDAIRNTYEKSKEI